MGPTEANDIDLADHNKDMCIKACLCDRRHLLSYLCHVSGGVAVTDHWTTGGLRSIQVGGVTHSLLDVSP